MRNGIQTFTRTFPQARSMWSVDVPRVGRIEAFLLGRSIVLIQEYSQGDGWNAFTPTTDEGAIDQTLKAIAARCGVTSDRCPCGCGSVQHHQEW